MRSPGAAANSGRHSHTVHRLNATAHRTTASATRAVKGCRNIANATANVNTAKADSCQAVTPGARRGAIQGLAMSSTSGRSRNNTTAYSAARSRSSRSGRTCRRNQACSNFLRCSGGQRDSSSVPEDRSIPAVSSTIGSRTRAATSEMDRGDSRNVRNRRPPPPTSARTSREPLAAQPDHFLRSTNRDHRCVAIWGFRDEHTPAEPQDRPLMLAMCLVLLAPPRQSCPHVLRPPHGRLNVNPEGNHQRKCRGGRERNPGDGLASKAVRRDCRTTSPNAAKTPWSGRQSYATATQAPKATIVRRSGAGHRPTTERQPLRTRFLWDTSSHEHRRQSAAAMRERRRAANRSAAARARRRGTC